MGPTLLHGRDAIRPARFLRDVVALQRLDGRRARLPSLRDCCATWLRRRLDKSEQCSDWDRRPLSASQLAYAALDASVLLPLHDAMVAAR